MLLNQQFLLIALPSWTMWILAIILIILVVVWIRTLIDVANATFKNSIDKYLWFLFVLFTGIIGALIYKAWSSPKPSSFNIN